MKKNVRFLCIVGTVYGLYLYLLSHTKKEIDETFFVTRPRLVKKQQSLKHILCIRDYKIYRIPFVNYVVFRFYYRFLLMGIGKRYEKIYAQDHLLNASYILGSREYTFIEDAPNSLGLYRQMEVYGKKKSFLEKPKWIKRWRYFWKGYAYGLPHGLSEKATSILAYANCESYEELGKEVIPASMLDKQEAEKIQLILDVFSIKKEDVESWKKRDIILFTQPLCVDKLVTSEEHSRIYASILEKYPQEKMVIKVHPRDTFRYEDISQKAVVVRGQFPSQIFDLLDVHFERAVTVFSTSVLSITYPIKIDWWGTKISNQLYEKLGNIKYDNK